MRLPGRSVNAGLATPDTVRSSSSRQSHGSAGDRFSLTFESAQTRWRQGVWLAVDGELVVNGQAASQVVLWRDTAPDNVQIEVASTGDGLMRLYNVWDSGLGLGRGRGRWESQSHTSGMVREAVSDGTDTAAVTSALPQHLMLLCSR